MKTKIQNSHEQKQRLISGIANEIDQMKSNLIRRVTEMPDGDFANLSDFITPKKAASIIGISLPTLHKYTELGILKKYRLGNKIYYRQDELFEAIGNQFNNLK